VALRRNAHRNQDRHRARGSAIRRSVRRRRLAGGAGLRRGLDRWRPHRRRRNRPHGRWYQYRGRRRGPSAARPRQARQGGQIAARAAYLSLTRMVPTTSASGHGSPPALRAAPPEASDSRGDDADCRDRQRDRVPPRDRTQAAPDHFIRDDPGHDRLALGCDI
jgi:hypothetical protein